MIAEGKTRPGDLSIQYDWCEGSVPPPYHYEYSVRIGPGAEGKVIFCPDYPGADVPVWREAFEVAPHVLDTLYALMVEVEVFQKHWTRIEDAAVGGSLEWLTGTAHGAQFRIPSRIQEAEAVQGIYRAIKAAVPETVWARLMSRQEQYEQDYLDRPE
jgi:hypothetical protein